MQIWNKNIFWYFALVYLISEEIDKQIGCNEKNVPLN
jgi:hypothetical protein